MNSSKKIFFTMISLLIVMSCKKGSLFTESKRDGAEIRKPDLPLKIMVENKIIPGFSDPNTPPEFNRVGYHRYYLKGQKNPDIPVLIIISGYVADTAWFNRMARLLVIKKNIEVWAINRRETFVEDRAGLMADINKFIKNDKSRAALIRKMNRTSNYLLCSEEFIRHWGFDVQIEDIKRVVEAAKKHSRNIFLGGWSDGVEYVMIYTNFRFESGFGSEDLKGIVFFDENPEWGRLSQNRTGFKVHIRRQKNLMRNNHLYMKYLPSLAVHTLALHLARWHPKDISPLAKDFRLPEEIVRKGITNKSLIGWLYDDKIDRYNKKERGAFAYLLKSGNLSDISEPKERDAEKKPEAPHRWIGYRESGDISDLNSLINNYNSGGRMWEYFYPRKVLLDYFILGECGFNCPDLNVYHNRENRLPIFYILTGTNNVGKSIPAGLKWYMDRSGITRDLVRFLRLYHYAHGDMFYAEKGDAEIYSPLYSWIQKISNKDEKIEKGEIQ